MDELEKNIRIKRFTTVPSLKVGQPGFVESAKTLYVGGVAGNTAFIDEDGVADKIQTAGDARYQKLYVDRGDPASADYSLANFTKDGAWHDLDLSSIIGSGRRLVFVSVSLRANSVGLVFYLRENGNSNTANILSQITQVSGAFINLSGPVLSDDSGVIEYYASNSANWTWMNFTVRGWFPL